MLAQQIYTISDKDNQGWKNGITLHKNVWEQQKSRGNETDFFLFSKYSFLLLKARVDGIGPAKIKLAS